jgi:hypothetical protein
MARQVEDVFSEQSVQDEVPQGHQTRGSEPGHDPHEADIRLIVVGFGTLVGVVVMFLLVARGMLGLFQHHPAQPATAPTPLALIPRQPPPPRVLDDVPEYYTDLRRADEATLNSYGWVDRAHGIVHIPIERAKDILLQRGLPTRPSAQGGATESGPPNSNAREASGEEPLSQQPTGAQRSGIGPTGRER